MGGDEENDLEGEFGLQTDEREDDSQYIAESMSRMYMNYVRRSGGDDTHPFQPIPSMLFLTNGPDGTTRAQSRWVAESMAWHRLRWHLCVDMHGTPCEECLKFWTSHSLQYPTLTIIFYIIMSVKNLKNIILLKYLLWQI